MTRYRSVCYLSRKFRKELPEADTSYLPLRLQIRALEYQQDGLCFTTRYHRRQAVRLAAAIGFDGEVLVAAHRMCMLCQIFIDNQRRCPECKKTKYIEWCPGIDGGCPRCVLAEADAITEHEIDREVRSLFSLEASL